MSQGSDQEQGLALLTAVSDGDRCQGARPTDVLPTFSTDRSGEKESCYRGADEMVGDCPAFGI